MHRDRSDKGTYAGGQASISKLVAKGASLKRIDEELAKCKGLGCANCHKMETDGECAAMAAAE